jgi:hypothetical protein
VNQWEGKAMKDQSYGIDQQVTSVTQTRQAVARDSCHCEMVSTKVLDQAERALGSEVFGDASYGAAAKACGQCEKVLSKVLGQAGSVPNSRVSNDVLRGGDGAVGVQGGVNPKGRWVQALLSPAQHSVEVACLPIPGKVLLREEAVSDKGVFAFNAKVELYNCREWLKRIKGEVDVGLQKLDTLLRDVDFNGPGQGHMGKEWVPKPKRMPQPRGKKFFIPKAPSVGLGLGPYGCKANVKPKSFKTTVVGLSGHLNGPLGRICAEVKTTKLGLGLAAGWSGLFGGDSSKETGSTGFAVGRPGACDPKSDGSAVRASSLRLGESGSGSSSKKAGMNGVDECTESTSKRGVMGLVQLLLVQEGKEPSSPAKEGKVLCVKTPVSLRLEKRAAVTEPIKLQVY